MLKLSYGYRGAPRAWRTKLHQVLEQWLSCQPLYSEPELYCFRKFDQRSLNSVIGRARERDSEQREICEIRRLFSQTYGPGTLQCLLSVHVRDINGTAPRQIADSSLAQVNKKLGQRTADYGSCLHTGIQHEHSFGVVFTHQYVYVGSITQIQPSMLYNKDEGELCDTALHEAYRSVPGALAWAVLTRAELSVYVQVLQRRAHAPRVKDSKRLNLVIEHMKRHKCGLKSVKLSHPLELVGFTDVAFKAQRGELTGFALRGLAATLQENADTNNQPTSVNGQINLVDFIVRRQRRVVRSTSSAGLNGLADRVEQVLLLQVALHKIHCGAERYPEDLIDLLETGGVHPHLDLAVHVRAAQ